ncbi:hypothetical protein L1887_60954 [Cichorium endivia]|nr:hypothetical protein L1887_60954 [Cichorium endivia]
MSVLTPRRAQVAQLPLQRRGLVARRRKLGLCGRERPRARLRVCVACHCVKMGAGDGPVRMTAFRQALRHRRAVQAVGKSEEAPVTQVKPAAPEECQFHACSPARISTFPTHFTGAGCGESDF